MCSPYCGGPQSTIVCLELSRRRRLGFGHLHGSLEKRMKLGAFFSISSNVEGVVTVEKLSVGVLQQGLVTLFLLLSSSFLSFLSSLLPLLLFLPSLLLGLLKNDVNERGRLMSTGPIFREVAGKFDLCRSRCWRFGFKSDAIRTLQPLHHCSIGYQPSTT